MATEQTVSYLLRSIKTSQYSLNEETFPQSVSEVQYGMSFGFGILKNQQPNSLMVAGRFELESNKHPGAPFIILQMECAFQLIGHTLAFEGSKYIVPKNIAQALSAVLLGVCRGALHAKTENTKYNKYYLPLLDLNSYIEGDITIDVRAAE